MAIDEFMEFNKLKDYETRNNGHQINKRNKE